MNNLTADQLAKYFDHTQLKAYATEDDFRALCAEAKQHNFMMVAINSVPVATCKALLAGSDVHVGAAISFPLGQTTIAVKCFETERAIAEGADEIDYVINVGKLKEGNYAWIEEEMRAIVTLCRAAGVCSKVIFETCYLTKDEIVRVAEIAREVKPDFVKTSTGFGTAGATVEDVALMKKTVGDAVKVKASGGVRDLDTCLAMIAAGAERIGSSNSVKILEEFRQRYPQ
ncbi:deoxyribose-phosphate aldolase [Entomohabitans teleogrylli]|uniref:deoxyribose-phosphate aldolase n=1 Tax=Entomohabitans teleogrylli TaxID=1384589 RepID=UPI00073D73A9|nr:deoxyribose-phosphate aldolase [Entomohabitans teleogrylli]